MGAIANSGIVYMFALARVMNIFFWIMYSAPCKQREQNVLDWVKNQIPLFTLDPCSRLGELLT
jgi:hypothetical protein